jgi:hypothetical protein
MNSKAALIFAMACIGMASLSPAKSQYAATSQPKTTAGAQVHVPGLPSAPPPVATTVPKTPYGAGYFVYPFSPNVGSVSATFTLPSITCQRQGDYEWLLPGIWVYDTSGNLTQQVDINLNCNNGALVMIDVICIAGVACDESLTVSPGDRIVATLSETPSGTFGQIHNLTTGQIAKVSGPATTSDNVVFVGDEGPSLSTVTRVPTFSTVPFSKVQINGYYLSDSPSPTRYNLATTGTTTQITTSPIEGDGDHFVTTFKHN